jgi:lipoate-protein ligase B
MPLSRFLERGTLNFIYYGSHVKTASYTNKMFKINLFWTAMIRFKILEHRESILFYALVIDLGRMDFRECWSIQHEVHLARVESRLPDCLLLVEHPHVFTIGKNGDKRNILVPGSFLEKKGIDIVSIERGGDVTYHGPGQIIGYPIFLLKGHRFGVTELVSLMEEVMIQVLKDFGINGERNRLNRGVWVGKEKIGFIGIAVRRSVVMHGFALNVSPDLSFFKMIHSCGLKDVNITSMSTLLKKHVDSKGVKKSVVSHFRSILNLDMEEINRELLLKKIDKAIPNNVNIVGRSSK